MRRQFLAIIFFGLLLSSVAGAQTLGLSAPQLFDKGMNSLMGVGVSRNDLDAVDYIRRSAELGYVPAQVVLGSFYDTGSRLPQNSMQAMDWYKKAAQQDDRLADWLLGRLYFAGFGIPRDLSAAESWLQKAAGQDDPFGEHLLGMIKLERNAYPQAAELFQKAAWQGLPQAQQQLGDLYKDGRGVKADKFEAYVWLLVSFEGGNQSVAGELQRLEAELGTNRVEEAKTKARDLQEKVSRTVVGRGCIWPGYANPVPLPPPADIQRFCRQ
jgi:TPR repeat protein